MNHIMFANSAVSDTRFAPTPWSQQR